MQQRASEEVRQRWKENILKQRDSGISVAAWCRQHNLPVHAFFYWRDKFFPSKAITRMVKLDGYMEKNTFMLPQV